MSRTEVREMFCCAANESTGESRNTFYLGLEVGTLHLVAKCAQCGEVSHVGDLQAPPPTLGAALT